MDVPEIRYATSGDLRIAYQVVGSGELDLVFIQGFVSNLDLCWEEPGCRSLITSIEASGLSRPWPACTDCTGYFLLRRP
jgi:hypothetical protein